jgi:hypothetical protein
LEAGAAGWFFWGGNEKGPLNKRAFNDMVPRRGNDAVFSFFTKAHQKLYKSVK